jgi:hypothetical protein
LRVRDAAEKESKHLLVMREDVLLKNVDSSVEIISIDSLEDDLKQVRTMGWEGAQRVTDIQALCDVNHSIASSEESSRSYI